MIFRETLCRGSLWSERIADGGERTADMGSANRDTSITNRPCQSCPHRPPDRPSLFPQVSLSTSQENREALLSSEEALGRLERSRGS